MPRSAAARTISVTRSSRSMPTRHVERGGRDLRAQRLDHRVAADQQLGRLAAGPGRLAGRVLRRRGPARGRVALARSAGGVGPRPSSPRRRCPPVPRPRRSWCRGPPGAAPLARCLLPGGLPAGLDAGALVPGARRRAGSPARDRACSADLDARPVAGCVAGAAGHVETCPKSPPSIADRPGCPRPRCRPRSSWSRTASAAAQSLRARACARCSSASADQRVDHRAEVDPALVPPGCGERVEAEHAEHRPHLARTSRPPRPRRRRPARRCPRGPRRARPRAPADVFRSSSIAAANAPGTVPAGPSPVSSAARVHEPLDPPVRRGGLAQRLLGVVDRGPVVRRGQVVAQLDRPPALQQLDPRAASCPATCSSSRRRG